AGRPAVVRERTGGTTERGRCPLRSLDGGARAARSEPGAPTSAASSDPAGTGVEARGTCPAHPDPRPAGPSRGAADRAVRDPSATHTAVPDLEQASRGSLRGDRPLDTGGGDAAGHPATCRHQQRLPAGGPCPDHLDRRIGQTRYRSGDVRAPPGGNAGVYSAAVRLP